MSGMAIVGPGQLDLGLVQDKIGRFNANDEERKHFLDTVLDRLYKQQDVINELQIELNDQQRSRKVYQQDAAQLQLEVNSLQRRMNKDPFVVVLVDGDGAKFHDALVRDAANGSGGAEAAQRLKQAVRSYLRDANTGLDIEDVPILVNVYVNLSGLAMALRLNGTIPSDMTLFAFAEQFNKSLAEFNIINVGRGKENADSKMRKMLRFYYKNVQCQKIFFAGCHDNGYVHDLSEKRGEPDAEQRIVLVETTPAEPAFKHLNFPLTRFDDVFRSELLNNETKAGVLSPPLNANGHMPAAGAAPMRNGFGSLPARPATTSSPQMSRPILATAASQDANVASPMSNNSSNTIDSTPPPQGARSITPITNENVGSTGQHLINASGNGGLSIRYPNGGGGGSYASAGGDANHQNIVLEQNKTQPARVIYYNREGHRLDPPLQNSYNLKAQETYRDKLEACNGRVFCNDYYLAGYCPYGNTCNRDHSTNLTPAELSVHRFKARTSPCSNGPTCEDYDCYLSHHCPQDPRCMRGSKCRFSEIFSRHGNLHIIKQELLVPTEKWVEGRDQPEPVRR